MYRKVIMANGEICIHRHGDAPGHWTPKNDPDLLKWMGNHGYSDHWELETKSDRRGPERCEVCSARGVELHHWAPREWFADECEKWPTGYLCPPCHRYWHTKADLAAARVTLRVLRSKRLDTIANAVEAALNLAEATDVAAD